jgi:hypothetical protein
MATSKPARRKVWTSEVSSNADFDASTVTRPSSILAVTLNHGGINLARNT